jgi:GIY-YIG catalytic domain
MTIGIYMLVFPNTTKMYIGQSTNIEKRLSSHISHIKAGTSSSKLIEAFNNFGYPKIEVLLECEESELDALETSIIAEMGSVKNGLNTLEKACDMPKPDNSGYNNGMSIVPNKKIEEVFLYMVENLLEPLKSIAVKFGVSYNIVNAMASCTNHRWLKLKYPIEYCTLENGIGRYNGKSAKDRGIVYSNIISPEGIEYSIDNIRQFAILHNLDRGSLCKLLNKKARSHKGWKLA